MIRGVDEQQANLSAPAPASLRLVPYLPRLVVSWAAEAPGRMVREEDGSLVFVDISGFTRMSERLARHGRIGAEEVTDVLGAVFARLLAVAYAEGAGLLKFGGDALLLWFPGDDHPDRAVRAAHGMRATLRSIGAVETSAGAVTLRMSIGVNSGRFHFFLVGGSHRELLVTGPAATETVRMENAATAGEILLSPATAAALPGRLLGKAKGPGWLLRSAPRGLSSVGTDAALPAPLPDLEPYVPLALRESIEAGTEPEHRSATIAFVHFDGTDELIEREGPDSAAAALDELVRHVQSAVDEHEVCFLGSDIDADGGKLILTAGVPRMLGDDDERLLLALRRVVDGERRLAARIGVNRGSIFSGDVGPPYRRTYTVMGDPVNLAARLMARAGPGQVFATAGVLENSASRFETAELDPFMVKGKARPVQAWAIGASIGRPKHTAAQDLPLTGRDDELRQLTEALDAARAGRRQTVLLRGEAGAGKTRLLDEVLERGTDLAVFGATGESFTSTTPYVAWRDVLREVIGVNWEAPASMVVDRLRDLIDAHDPSLRPWVPLIATAADAPMEPTPQVTALAPEYRRPRLHDAVIALLRVLLPGPTLFAFEDAHLMDEASADLLRAIVSDGREDRPWLVLALRRPEGAGFAPAEGTTRVLDLPPLDADAARALAAVVTDEAPLSERVLIETVDRAAGNPQLLLDLIHAARAGDGSLPDSVEAAATVRIDALAPHDRQLVRRVSVFGLAFHPRYLPDVLDAGAAMPTASAWDRLAEFFEPEGNGYLRFRRAVIRDAAYAGLPFRLRQRLHVAIGSHREREMADPDEIAGLLSLHFALGGDHPRAWRYGREAAARAAKVFANVEAAILYQRALTAARASGLVPPREMAIVAEARADALFLAGEFRDSGDALDLSRKLMGADPQAEARLLLKRSRIEEKLGRFSGALRWATRARQAVEGIDGIEAAQQRADQSAWTATLFQAKGRSNEAVAWAERAIAEGNQAGALEALARAYNALDWARLQLGEVTGDAWTRALEIYRGLDDLAGQALILSNLGMGAFYAGHWDEALGYAEQGRELQLRIGNYALAAVDATNMAELRSEQGAYQEAEVLLRDSVRVARAAGHRWGLGLALSVLALLLARTGRFDEASSMFDDARTEWDHVGAAEDVELNEARRAECSILMGDGPRALAIIDGVLAPGRAAGEIGPILPQLERVRGYALSQIGDAVGARAALERSLVAASERDDLLQRALTLTALTRLDRHEGRSPSRDDEAAAATALARLGVRHVAEVPLVETSAGR
jgi:class 3 adenylate cyclase/tetratricopeptide (TPR) repeat protein